MVRKKVKKREYDTHSIRVLEGPEKIRDNASMYIGEMDHNGLLHQIKEIVGNSLDEAFNGHGDTILVSLKNNGEIIVVDEGRGIPVGPHPKHKGKDTLTLLCTELHSGGKFDNEDGDNAYTSGVGVHGLGLGVVNATSSNFDVWSWRNRTWNHQAFEEGNPVKDKPIKVKSLPKEIMNNLSIVKRGTVIRFTPDYSIFDKGSKLKPEHLLEWLEDLSYFGEGITFKVYIEGQKPMTVSRENGLQDWFTHCCEDANLEPLSKPLIHHSEHLDVMLGWVNGSSTEDITTMVSTMRTLEGGTHALALNAVLSEAFGKYKTAKQVYDNRFIRAGLIAVVNVKMRRPKFASQNKVKLVSPEGKEFVRYELLSDDVHVLYNWMNKNKKVVKQVIERAIELTVLHGKHSADAALVSELKTESRGKVSLPKELKISTTKNDSERELFVVEGDSASGSGVAARDKRTQEILPLSGKIPNVFKDAKKALQNERVINLLKSIGYNPKNPDEFRVGKVIILVDPDDDGAHIQALLLSLFQKVTPELLEQGKVFVVDSSLFVYRLAGGDMILGSDMRELRIKFFHQFPTGKFDSERNVTRIKGWGEVDADILAGMAFDPEKRKLIEVGFDIEDDSQAMNVISLMGDNTEARRMLLGLD